MGIDDSAERSPGLLTLARFNQQVLQQVLILRKQYSPRCRGTFEEQFIGESICTVIVGGQDIEIALAQSGSDGARNMLIHVEREGHQRCRSLFKRAIAGTGGISRCNSSARPRPRAISSSSPP